MLVVASLAMTTGPAISAAPTRPAGPAAAVIVQHPAGAEAAGALVAGHGGEVTRALPLVDGVGAILDPSELAAVTNTPGVNVTPDRQMQVQSGLGDLLGPVLDLLSPITGLLGGSVTTAGTTTTPPPYTSVYRDVVGATALHAQGLRGDGVTVAVLDTGVADVPDLTGRVVQVRDDMTGRTSSCVNLSGESGCGDSYGHGTFMAGLIAGSGAGSGGQHMGMAPGSKILSLKVAGREGAADVSTVLAAIQWVVSFKDRYGIRVLNLSLGTDSVQTYRSDPLNYAVERAWAAGVAVVVAAANRGPDPGTISKPGDDPFVLTVGAIDDRGTVASDDDHIPDFTSRGPTAADGLAKPDVAAPGAHVVSLAAPGSAVATNFPSPIGGGHQVGNGTSMATAVVSGAAALLLGADPTLTPDRLKFALTATARPTDVVEPAAVGAGVIDAVAARQAPPGVANEGLPRSSGLGSLDASRGNVKVATLGSSSTLITGMQTAQLAMWDPIGFVTGKWTPTAWYLSPFYLKAWRAVAWQGSKWQGSKWHGSKWHGGIDTTTSYGRKWQGSDWYGAWD